jgi:DNA polymerase III delta subunit
VLTFILGPDGYRARMALTRLRAEVDPDGLNTDLIDGRVASVDEIVRTANTPAFFGGPRTVIVEDFFERLSKSKSADNAESSPKSKGQPDLAGLFSSLPRTQNIVFYDRGAAIVPAAAKKLLPTDAEVQTHEAPRGPELIVWMREQAKAGGAQLPDQLARKIAEALYPKTWTSKPSNPLYDQPPELERLAHEIEKLTLAAHPGPITADLIDDLVIGSTEDRLFPLIEAIYASEIQGAARDLAAARDRGDDPGRITNALYQQAELAAALAQGYDAVQTGQEIGLSNPNRMYGVGKSSQRSKRSTKDWLRRFIETERAAKSGQLRDPWDPLYAALDSID